MGRILLLIGLGGFLGSIGRFLTGMLFIKYWPSSFPLGTFAANVLGCLVIGIIYGLSERYDWMNPQLKLFLATGFCGGYTTFSSFTFENLELLQAGNYLLMALYTLLSITLGLMAVFLGVMITKI